MIDGLLLVRCSLDLNRSELSLWNPCIRKSVSLPRCPLNSGAEIERHFYLGVDSSGNHKVVGFELGDFKASELSTQIAIYSLRDHCWRVKPSWINIPRCWFEVIESQYGVIYCQGSLYWRPKVWSCVEYTHLLSFDLNAEEFSYLKMPVIGEEMLRFYFLLGGSLALLGISRVRACVWVMEKNAGKELWRRFSSGESKLDAYELFVECKGNHHSRMMYIENSGTLLVHKVNKLMFYNILCHQVQQRKYYRCSNLVTCMESLVLHDGSTST
ncbi:uncharacterized protein LOC110700432 isoform X1 [Chenopodium quinoa]|uniref:uncharacterized protein LOC110700432 isoform X1 n=1 Tax=Chenopodium quinoa TaxID=63459 RepID=UPI000B7719A3|nr:uncharacterized protein LOC110700432 isoform X1 [Chenopodium quinoa]